MFHNVDFSSVSRIRKPVNSYADQLYSTFLFYYGNVLKNFFVTYAMHQGVEEMSHDLLREAFKRPVEEKEYRDKETTEYRAGVH